MSAVIEGISTRLTTSANPQSDEDGIHGVFNPALSNAHSARTTSILEQLRSLPQEIRDIIFEHYVYSDAGIAIKRKTFSGCYRNYVMSLQPAPLFCSGSLHEVFEFLPELYAASLRCNEFHIQNGLALYSFKAWLHGLGPNGFANVRALHFPNFWRFATEKEAENGYVTLAKKCPGLIHLRLGFSIGIMSIPQCSSEMATMIVNRLGIDSLFQHKKLRSIEVHFIYVESIQTSTGLRKRFLQSMEPLETELQRRVVQADRHMIINIAVSQTARSINHDPYSVDYSELW